MLMTRHILTLLFLTIALTCSAQSIEKRYRSYLSERGTINFFRPKKLDVKANVDKFIFDMTYVSRQDSIIINSSLSIKDEGVLSQFKLKSGEKEIPGEAVTMLYRDVTKQGYTIRISSRFLIKDIEECFSSNSPLIFTIVLTDGTVCTATYKPSQWKQERLQVTRILQSINF